MGSTQKKNGITVTGFVTPKNKIWQMVTTITYPDKTKTKPKWKSTKLPEKGNKYHASAMLSDHINDVLEEAIIHSGNVAIYSDKETSLCSYLYEYIDYKEHTKNSYYKIEPATAIGYRRNVKGHFEPYFTEERGITLESLTADNLEAFYDDRREAGLSENTIRKFHDLLRGGLTFAVRKLKLIKENVTSTMEPPKVELKLFPYYSAKDMQQYMEKLNGHILLVPVTIACYFGLRRGEICGLKWDAIDFTNNTLSVFRRICLAPEENDQRYECKEGTKTQEGGMRSFPLLPEVRRILMAEYNKQELFKRHYGMNYNDNGYVCVWPDGTPLLPDFITQKHRKTLKKFEMPHIRFHDLRHSCASLLAANGYSLPYIAEYMGHKDLRSTKRYAHLGYDTKINMAETISDAFTPSSNLELELT